MPKFKCKLASPDGGRMIEQFRVADSEKELQNQLERDGYFVFDIQKTDGLLAFLKSRQQINRIKAKEFLAFNHEFVVLIKAGLPIVSALDAIIENEDERGLNNILKRIRERVATGEALSEAFSAYAHLFSYLYIATLEAGEKSGNLPLAISRYIRYTQKMAAIKQKIISASVYPSILTVVSVFTVLFLLVYVVPAFTQTYFESGARLPLLTQTLVDFSNYIKTCYLYMAAFAIVAVSGLVFFSRSSEGQKKTDQWKTAIPFVGLIYRYYATSKFTRTLATVLGGGTPLVEALKISTGALDNHYYQSRLKKVVGWIEEGAGFAESLQKVNIFPKLAVRMVDAGEKGGALEQVLTDIADFYENDVDSKLEMLTSCGFIKSSRGRRFNLNQGGKMSVKHTVVASAVMLLTMALLYMVSQTENIYPNKPFRTFPQQIGQWRGRVLSFDDKIYAVLGVDDSFLASYHSPANRLVQLYVGFYQSQREGDLIHSPKNCMPGAGWNIVQTTVETVEGFKTAPQKRKLIKLVLQKGAQKQIVLYWFQSRGRIIASEYMQKVYLVWDAITRQRTDGSFVRLIAPVLNGDDKRAWEDLKRFARLLDPLLDAYLPS